jgi:two-component system, OmpR family, response regulator
MSSARILHVDDEPDIRAVVELSLTIDPEISIKSCESGEAALSIAPGWQPDLILLDVMMPAMDGPTTLARLQENPHTANIPVVFMTARAQKNEIETLRSLGAAGVIVKPFDPLSLAPTTRGYLQSTKKDFASLRRYFMDRARHDSADLEILRAKLPFGYEGQSPSPIARVKEIAHGLAGSGGIFGFAAISVAAAKLEDAAVASISGTGKMEAVEQALQTLTRRIDTMNAE